MIAALSEPAEAVSIENHGLPLISVPPETDYDAPYDTTPDLAERFEADRAARYVRLVGLFLALCCWAGAELATAFAFREFALAPLIAAACFAIVSRRVWAALA